MRLLQQQQLGVAGQPATQGIIDAGPTRHAVEGQHGHRVGPGHTRGQCRRGAPQQVDPRIPPAVHVRRRDRVLVLAGRLLRAAAGRHHPGPHHPGRPERRDGHELVGCGRQTEPDQPRRLLHRDARLDQRSQIGDARRGRPAQHLRLCGPGIGVADSVHRERLDTRTESQNLSGCDADLGDDRLRGCVAAAVSVLRGPRCEPHPLHGRGDPSPATGARPLPQRIETQRAPRRQRAATPDGQCTQGPSRAGIGMRCQRHRGLGQINASKHAVQFVDRDSLARLQFQRGCAGVQFLADPVSQHRRIAPVSARTRADEVMCADVPALLGPVRGGDCPRCRRPGGSLGVERLYLDAIAGRAREIGQAPTTQRPRRLGQPVVARGGRPALRRHLTAASGCGHEPSPRSAHRRAPAPPSHRRRRLRAIGSVLGSEGRPYGQQAQTERAASAPAAVQRVGDRPYGRLAQTECAATGLSQPARPRATGRGTSHCEAEAAGRVLTPLRVAAP